MNTRNNTSIDPTIWNKLKDLQIEGEPDIILELIEVYVEHSPPLVREIGKHLDDKRLDLAARGAHSLKSSSFSLGATKLGSLCDDLEKLGSSNSYNEALSLGKKIQDEFSSVIQELSQIKMGLLKELNLAVKRSS